MICLGCSLSQVRPSSWPQARLTSYLYLYLCLCLCLYLHLYLYLYPYLVLYLHLQIHSLYVAGGIQL